MSDADLFPSQAEIFLEKCFNGRAQPDFNDFDAVLNCVSRMDTVKKLQYRDFQYMINTEDPIEVAPGIFFELLDKQNQTDQKTGVMQKITYRLYSDDHGIKELKDYVKKCRQEYEAARNNKLGNEVFFFDQITTKDSAKSSALSFDKKKFETNRTFDNVFFEERAVVEKRVKHFMGNKAWYAKRGIPYTLGFMFHGTPGTGKTSTIKAIANITGRHIINVRLSDVHTNTQLKNLFYNPVIQVINPETMQAEKFTVPTHQRLYLIEDIDCMTDLIKRRDVTDSDVEEETVKKPAKKVVKKEDKKKKDEKERELDSDEELERWRDEALAGEKADMRREADEELEADRITKDSMFNILDGTLEIPDRMIAITTNFPDVIDEALIRPGRIDMIVEFKKATRAVMLEQFEAFYDEDFELSEFEKIRDYKVSQAQVNAVMFKNFDKPKAAIEELTTLSNKRRPYAKKKKDEKDA
jgi:hypothetical protein